MSQLLLASETFPDLKIGTATVLFKHSGNVCAFSAFLKRNVTVSEIPKSNDCITKTFISKQSLVYFVIRDITIF